MTNIFEESWGKWSWMTQESQKFSFLAADNACNALFWHAAGYKQRGLGISGFSAQGTLVLVSYGMGMLWRIRQQQWGEGTKEEERMTKEIYLFVPNVFSWWCCTCIHIIISYFLSPYLCGQRHCITFVCCFLLVVRCPELLHWQKWTLIIIIISGSSIYLVGWMSWFTA